MSHRSHRLSYGCLLALALVVVPLRLAAAPDRHALERTARKACLNGDYGKGVDILSDLFVDTKDVTYLFNQGRCFEQNRRYEDAIARFDEYLRVADEKLSPGDKAAAEKHISDCREKLAEERDSSPIQPAPQPSVVPPATPPAPPALAADAVPPSGAPPPVVAQSVPESTPPARRARLLTAGIITGAVGVASVVGGIVMNLKANAAINDMENNIGGYSSGKANDQKTYKTLAWVGYGAGAACVAAGAILVGFGLKGGAPSSANVALSPVVGPGQMGAALTGGF